MSKLFSLIMGILSLLTVPVIVLNLFGGIIGGIWLAFLGQWSLILSGLIIVFFGHFVVSLLLIPGTIVGAPALWAFNKGRNILGALLAVPTVLWTYLLLTIWCSAAIIACVQHMHGEHLLPALLWGYLIATSPWTYLAQFDARNDPNNYSTVTSFAAQIGCIVVMLDFLFSTTVPTRADLLRDLVIPLFLAFLFQVSLAIAQSMHERSYQLE